MDILPLNVAKIAQPLEKGVAVSRSLSIGGRTRVKIPDAWDFSWRLLSVGHYPAQQNCDGDVGVVG